MVELPPLPSAALGLYLHFPFCAIRCSYCDFPTVAGRDDTIEAYLAALEREIASCQSELPLEVDTVYFGGGTPSRMSPEQLGRLLEALRGRFRLLEGCEITVECNPESLHAGKLGGYRDAGVTRISIGLQSLDDRVLRRVGRAHDAAAGLAALELARSMEGLEVNIDLIAGLPGEAMEGWPESVREVARREPDHVSVYLLELDKETSLSRSVRRGRTRVADDLVLARAYDETVRVLEEHGLVLYEISNFARNGKVSRHNRKYWTDAWYGGFGLGAHGYSRGARRSNRLDLDGYVRSLADGGDPRIWSDPWNPQRRLEEALISGLRLVAGLDPREVGGRYGVDLFSEYDDVWERGRSAGLLELDDARIRLTGRGRLHSNELFAEILRC